MKIMHRRCSCCGNYYQVTEENKNEKFCSEECKHKYYRCTVCGHYYLPDDFIDLDKLICSKECLKKYKFIRKKENPKFDLNNL